MTFASRSNDSSNRWLNFVQSKFENDPNNLAQKIEDQTASQPQTLNKP
jgi:hypothetical protein